MIPKQRAKQLTRRLIGEPYVGKRLKQIRVGKILDALHLQPESILDAGSEDATFVYWLADRYPRANVTAIDIDTQAIAACVAARPRAYANRVHFIAGPFAELPEEAFDLVTAFDVLEHIEDDQAAVLELSGALRPGGTLLVHVPRDRWRTWGGEIKAVPDDQAWRINAGHVRQGYSPESLSTILARAGLDVVEVQTWLGPWGVLAHSFYARLERPTPLRLLTVPVTVLAAHIESRHATPDGNTVFARATRSSTNSRLLGSTPKSRHSRIDAGTSRRGQFGRFDH